MRACNAMVPAALVAALVFPVSSAHPGAPLECTPPTSGLTAWHGGDGNSGDSTAAANNGTYHGGNSYSGSAKIGFAFALNGSTDSISAPSTAAIDPTSTGSQAVSTTTIQASTWDHVSAALIRGSGAPS